MAFRSVVALGLLAVMSGLTLQTNAADSAARPNIVFIYADDLGFGDLACHGHPAIKTPHLDRLARQGTDFWSFMVVNPVCSPSRTAIVTGQFPSRWGVHQHFATHEQNAARGMPDWLDPKAPSLPRVLKQAGYRTGHYGKWHLTGGAIKDAPQPQAYGYDDAATWTGGDRHVFEGAKYSFSQERPAHTKDAASWLSVAATDHAVDFIRQSQGEPFYINLWLHETHHLVSATEADKQPYPDTPEPQRTYYGAVSRADRQVGRILAVLDELAIADNTIVIFSSDNGPENTHTKPGEKFYYSVGVTGGLRGRKRSLLMGGVNVPFIVRWPGVVPAGRVDKQTSLAGVDLFPTLLAAVGVSQPDGYTPDGQNMLAAWKGEAISRSKPVFWWWQGKHSGDDWPAFAMRDGRWMLILDESKSRIELFDVVDDRAQANNLAAANPDRVHQMRTDIDEWFATLPKKIDPELQTKVSQRSAAAKASPQVNERGARKLNAAELAQVRARAMQRWDKDRDGKLSLTEYRNGLSKKSDAEQRFKRFDANGDGELTRQEYVGSER